MLSRFSPWYPGKMPKIMLFSKINWIIIGSFFEKVLGDLFMPHRFKWPSSYTVDLLVFFISYFSGFWPLFWQRGGYTVTCQTRQYQIFRDSSLQWEIIFGKNSSNLHYYRRPKKQVFSTYVHQNHRSILWYFSCMFKNPMFLTFLPKLH